FSTKLEPRHSDVATSLAATSCNNKSTGGVRTHGRCDSSSTSTFSKPQYSISGYTNAIRPTTNPPTCAAHAQPSLGNDALQLFEKSVGPSETPQERSNRLCREWRTVRQAAACAQPSLINDALQLFEESVGPSETPQERNNRLCRECRTVRQATT
ncbi:unnamed protein product, partial [Sphagnum compactum]